MTESAGSTKPSRWDHTALTVANLDLAKAFYQDAFGYEVVGERRGISETVERLLGVPGGTADVALLRSSVSSHQLELIAWNIPAGRESHGPTRPGEAHVAFVVEDLDRALAAVQRLGARPIGEVVTAPGRRFVYCREPSGTVIELDERTADG